MKVAVQKTKGLVACYKYKNWEAPVFWGNKNGLPSMKVKKFEKFQNKICLKGSKWSSLKAPATEIPLCHPYWEL